MPPESIVRCNRWTPANNSGLLPRSLRIDWITHRLVQRGGIGKPRRLS